MANRDEPQNDPNEPCLFFIFPFVQWKNQVNPITKIELLDIIPEICSNFYFDTQSKSFLLIIFKSKWNQIDSTVKRKFSQISRRLKEELEGIMTASQRETYENIDLFDLYKQRVTEKTPETPENTVVEDDFSGLDND